MSSDSAPPPAVSAPLRCCVFENRKGAEMRGLLEKQGCVVTVAPALREVPLEENPAALAFAARLLAGEIDWLILLTGVGTRALADAVETRYDRETFLAALRKTPIIVRGPKPASVLREWRVPFEYQVREPNTWRELLELLDAEVPVTGMQVAVQEYGQPNPELYAGLESRGAQVIPVPVYRWALPEETGPLEAAIRETLGGRFDVLVFTSAFQVHNLLQVAETLGLRNAWLEGAKQCRIASIGPTASEALRSLGLSVDVEPEHPKMGHLAVAVGRRGVS